MGDLSAAIITTLVCIAVFVAVFVPPYMRAYALGIALGVVSLIFVRARNALRSLADRCDACALVFFHRSKVAVAVADEHNPHFFFTVIHPDAERDGSQNEEAA